MTIIDISVTRYETLQQPTEPQTGSPEAPEAPEAPEVPGVVEVDAARAEAATVLSMDDFFNPKKK